MKQETNKTAGPEAGGTSGQSVHRSKFRQKSQQEQTAASKLRMEKRGEKLEQAKDKLAKQKPPKKPGLDEILAWLEQRHIPMVVASSSRMASIRHHLDGWGLTHYFKAVISGEQFVSSKPDPEIFLLTAEKLGVEPARCLVLEDSYNGVRAGAAGGFVTVMVPDLSPATDEMRRIYACECASLHEVRRKLECGEL